MLYYMTDIHIFKDSWCLIYCNVYLQKQCNKIYYRCQISFIHIESYVFFEIILFTAKDSNERVVYLYTE